MGTPIQTRLRIETFDTYCKVRCLGPNTIDKICSSQPWNTQYGKPQYALHIRDGGFPYRAVDLYFKPYIDWLIACDMPYVYLSQRLTILLASDDDLSLFKLRWL